VLQTLRHVHLPVTRLQTLRLTHAAVWIGLATFAAVWIPEDAAGIVALAGWARNAADKTVAAAMTESHLRIFQSSKFVEDVCYFPRLPHPRRAFTEKVRPPQKNQYRYALSWIRASPKKE
jgi:hypothetical protein